MVATALTVATRASAVFYANGNAGDWNIWSPNGYNAGSATVTTVNVGGPSGNGYSIIPNQYPSQDGGAYTFFGNGNSTPPPALISQDFSQSIAILLAPSVESGNLLIDETPSSTVQQNDGFGNLSYQLWSAENGFSLTGNGSTMTISAESGGTIGTISADGWYDFKLTFSTTGETLSVYNMSTHSTVGSVTASMDNSDLAGSGYLWMTEWDGSFTDPGTLDVAALGATPVPEPTTVLAGAMLLLPFGMSTLRMLRKNRTA